MPYAFQIETDKYYSTTDITGTLIYNLLRDVSINSKVVITLLDLMSWHFSTLRLSINT